MTVGLAETLHRSAAARAIAAALPRDWNISGDLVETVCKSDVAHSTARTSHPEVLAWLSVRTTTSIEATACESMFRNLQPGLREGDPQAVGVGLRVLEFEAKINGHIPNAKMKFIAQEEDHDEPTKSRAQMEADNAKYLDMFRGAVQILVDLGVPLPEVQPKAIETTATPVEELCENKNGTV